jgi:hypothetical protein
MEMNMCLIYPVITTVTTELLLLAEQSTYLLPATVPVWPHPKPEKEEKKTAAAAAKLTRETEQEGRAQAEICERCCPCIFLISPLTH